MPLYRFLALDEQGSEQSGSLEAADPRMLAAVLRRRALRVVRIEDPAEVQAHAEDQPRQLTVRGLMPIWLKDQVFFFQQMGLMLRSGLTVLQSLDTCRELARSPRLAAAIDRMIGRIRSGSGFSGAMQQEEEIFPVLAVWLIRSAEASGELDMVMDRVAQHLEHRADLKRHLITSLMYPTIVVIAAIGVCLFLMFSIIPKFSEFFAKTNRTLPPLTQSLVDVSSAFITAGPYLLLGFVLFVIFLIRFYKTKPGRLTLDRVFLFLPVVGAVITKAAMVQLTWSLAMLLKSGLNLLASLRISAGVIANRVIQNAVENAAEAILNGKDLSGSLAQSPVIPKEVIRLSAVGERTGALDEVMKELAAYYDKELQAGIKRMSAAIEPILILLIGGMVGFVYAAFFQAIMSLAG